MGLAHLHDRFLYILTHLPSQAHAALDVDYIGVRFLSRLLRLVSRPDHQRAGQVVARLGTPCYNKRKIRVKLTSNPAGSEAAAQFVV